MDTTPPPNPDVHGAGFSRRRLIVAASVAATAGIAAACSSEGSSDDDTGEADAAAEGSTFVLGAGFPVGEPFVGPGAAARLPFVIAAADGAPLDEIDGPVPFRVLRDGEQLGEAVDVEPRGEGLTRPYLPLVVTFPEPGIHTVQAIYRSQTLQTSVEVFPVDQLTVAAVGDPLPVVNTPTASDNRGVSPICTETPPCELHDLDLAEVVTNGRPTALLVSTPAFCQTAVCGPVLDLVVAAADGYPGVDIVHAEGYANPEEVLTIAEATPAPVIGAMGLTYEPALFVTDAKGTITSRLDLIFDAEELDDALAAVSS